MDTALKGVSQKDWAMPSGIISVKIDPVTGTRLADSVVDQIIGDLLGGKNPGMVEHFYQEFPPPEHHAADWTSDPDSIDPEATPNPALPGTSP
jgi:penicillin-binding protein 1A